MMISSESDIFQCKEESTFFQKSIEELVFSNNPLPKTIIELGSGDGYPVLEALKSLDVKQRPIIYGYEICEKSYKALIQNIKQLKMQDVYIAYNTSFFEAKRPECEFLISNPPYLPHESNDIIYPNLSGGLKGNSVSKLLLELQIKSTMLIVSSYSDPKELLQYATSLGYSVLDYRITDIKLEKYSKEPEVLKQINLLQKSGKAFLVNKDTYRIAAVLFCLDSLDKDKSLLFIEEFLS